MSPFRLSGFARLSLVGLVTATLPALADTATTRSDALPVLFDFGSDSSPVVSSAIGVTENDAYSRQRGYGWMSTQLQAFDRDQPLAELRHGGNPMRPDLLYRDHATELTRDGIASTKEMRFRIDVEPGDYRVHVWIGDLHHPLESLALSAGGDVIATGISAKHIVGRAQPESTGLYQILQFDAKAANGHIDLRFFGDETQYRLDQQRYDTWFPSTTRVASYLGNGFDPLRRLKFDPKGPFTRNSVLGVRVAQHQDKLIAWQRGTLNATTGADPSCRRFVEALNRGNFELAESVLDSRQTSAALRVRGLLALVGHPLIEGPEEERLLAKAEHHLATMLDASPPGILAVEAKMSLSVFQRARQRFLHRGMAEEGHFQENRKAVSLLRQIRPDDLLYWKSLEYQGRALQMLDPHRWVYPSGDAQTVWRELIKAFPDNRYARFFLKDQWQPDHIWHHSDHLQGTREAPAWARAQREAWGLLLDMCQWWADHKQHADGSIGGGWGDDVELVALFGLMGFISEGASEPSIDLARKLIDGLWRFGGIDQQAGFYRGVLDAEHSAEWTGDTLPLMLTIDHGNPIWIERATQTARLMRTLWMDYNERGDLHFKSNFLGSISIGDERQANDSYINYRAVLPAVAVYRYNRHPEIGRLLVEWADAWLADAMRTDRGKPRGVFPAEVGFPRGELGGRQSPNWFTSVHPPGTVNYDWQRGNYYGYLVSLMLLAREITGDDRYLEPFELQKQLVDRFRDSAVESSPAGSAPWAAKILSDGTPRGRQPFDEIWRRVSAAQTPGSEREPAVRIKRDEVYRRMNHVRQLAKQRWPVLTTETSATDRVGFRGMPDPFFIMTGTQDFHPAVTYAGIGREFASFVPQSDSRFLKVVMYNFSRRPVQAAIQPWKLEVGATYQLSSGIDTDGDNIPDRDVHQQTLKLKQRGQSVRFPFAPRATTAVQLRQVETGRGTQAYADLAVIAEQIKYSIWTRDLQVTIHNVGTEPAQKFRVALYEGMGAERRKIGEHIVPVLSWPKDFQPQRLMLGFPYIPKRSRQSITVIIDESQSIEELCETNNRATRTFDFDLEEIVAPRNRVGEIGGNISGEIKRGIR